MAENIEIIERQNFFTLEMLTIVYAKLDPVSFQTNNMNSLIDLFNPDFNTLSNVCNISN